MDILYAILFWGGIAILALVLTPICVLIGYCLFGPKPEWVPLSAAPPELLRRRGAEELKKLRDPDWAAFREHFHTEPPAALKSLYAQEEIGLVDFHIALQNQRWLIACFLPAAEAVQEDRFVFAEDGMGNSYFIRPGERGAGNPVWFYDHETREANPMGGDLQSFLDGEWQVMVPRRT